MTAAKTIHFTIYYFYPCFINNMKVHSRIITLLDYKNRQKTTKQQRKDYFLPT